MSCPVTSRIHGLDLDSLLKKTLVSRTSCIVNSRELSDVKFIFKNVSGTGSTNGHGHGHSRGQGGETSIYGHKLILALASPVFHKMFYMDTNNQQFVTTANDEIRMEGHGFNAEAFLQFIRFLYTDQICYKDLDFEVIAGILACADFYDVPCLKVDCEDQLMKMITKKNVIRILETAEMFRVRNLADKALEFIDHYLKSLETGDILCVKLDTLFEILKRDSLDIDESFVLDVALMWADWECSRKNLRSTAHNKIKVLGKVFFEIRFGLLASDRISELVHLNLLSREESLDIVLEVHTPGYVTTAGNSKFKRRRLAPEVRFKSNPRIFGQKKKLMEIQEMEKKWKEKNNFEYMKAKYLAKTRADLLMRGFPSYLTEDELSANIEGAKEFDVFDLDVYKLDETRGEFHVQFKYNSSKFGPFDLLNPAWYEFDDPRAIQISEWDSDDDDDDEDDD